MLNVAQHSYVSGLEASLFHYWVGVATGVSEQQRSPADLLAHKPKYKPVLR
jgi:hypothetical protein